jgi:hypothetical protein
VAVILDWEPVEVEGEVEDATERFTWGLFTLSIHVAGVERCLTRVEQVSGRTLARGVYGPAIAIAEWLAANYWHLVRSRRALPPCCSRSDAYAWRRVRTLSYVGDGMPLPEILFAPEDEDHTRIQCVAENAPAEYARVRFTESCDQVVETAALRAAIRTFVECILDRLRDTCPTEPRLLGLAELWATATNHDAPQHDAYVRACQSGELWGALSPEAAAQLGELPQRGELPPLDAVIERVPPGELRSWGTWAAKSWQAAGAQDRLRATSLLAQLRNDVASARAKLAQRSWQRGWNDAKRLRRVLAGRTGGTELPPIQAQREKRLADRETMIVMQAARQPLRLFGGKSTRFLEVRDLHAAIFDPRPASAILHSPWLVGSAAVANAFAAEWLAPVAMVREAVKSRLCLGLDDLMEIAEAIQAPAECVRRQVENHRLARIDIGS